MADGQTSLQSGVQLQETIQPLLSMSNMTNVTYDKQYDVCWLLPKLRDETSSVVS